MQFEFPLLLKKKKKCNSNPALLTPGSFFPLVAPLSPLPSLVFRHRIDNDGLDLLSMLLQVMFGCQIKPLVPFPLFSHRNNSLFSIVTRDVTAADLCSSFASKSKV